MAAEKKAPQGRRKDIDWETIRAEYEASFYEEVKKIDEVKRGHAVAYVRDQLVDAIKAFYRGFRAHLIASTCYLRAGWSPFKGRPLQRRGGWKWSGRKTPRRQILRANTGGMLRRYLKRPSEERSHKLKCLLGYGIAELHARLASTMPAGYTWGDFEAGELHIDHIIPDSAHNYSEPHHFDFMRSWSLKNLQLLPKNENLNKSDYLDAPFQPSLIF